MLLKFVFITLLVSYIYIILYAIYSIINTIIISINVVNNINIVISESVWLSLDVANHCHLKLSRRGYAAVVGDLARGEWNGYAGHMQLKSRASRALNIGSGTSNA